MGLVYTGLNEATYLRVGDVGIGVLDLSKSSFAKGSCLAFETKEAGIYETEIEGKVSAMILFGEKELSSQGGYIFFSCYGFRGVYLIPMSLSHKLIRLGKGDFT